MMDVILFSKNDFTEEVIMNPFPKEREIKDVQGQFASKQIITRTFVKSLLPSGYSSDEHASEFSHKKSSQNFRWHLFESHF